ncbi:hypothetical protein CK203_114190 [Vitis vinifera]|uniref:Retrotransposon gag domain-containing protein n=1 Tax=Vitis vinifera TaxID=29760 RepID=A0A438D7E2_VITVI|nr:hypothetical protein CK203_114190 [Vitis vinifera]
MCGGDDHLAWKRPVSSEACRGLRTAGGSDPVFPLFSLQLRVLGDRSLFVVPVLVQCPGLTSRHVVLEDTPSDLVTPPVLPVQMPATQTLERRIRQMRDPDEMISWDDPDDVPVATLPVDEAQLLTLFPLSLSGMTQRWYASLESSRRRTWEDLAQEFLRQYSFSGDTSVTRRELEFLRQGSDEPVSSFISRWREKAAEMIERPTERDQMSMFLRSLHPRFARHLTGVPFQDFRSLVQALFDVDDGISRGLCIDDLVIIPMRDHCRYPGVISHLYSIVILISSAVPFCASSYCHGATFIQFQRPQTSIPRMSSLVPSATSEDLF